MGYQSRKRNYKSRRERYEHTVRVTRLILIFGAIALVILVYKNRFEWWSWIKTYFY